MLNICVYPIFLLSLYIDNQNIMDKEAKNFLLRENLERHLESMSHVIDGIDPRQASKVVHPAPVIMMSALMGVFANCQTWNEIADFAEARISIASAIVFLLFSYSYFPIKSSLSGHIAKRACKVTAIY